MTRVGHEILPNYSTCTCWVSRQGGGARKGQVGASIFVSKREIDLYDSKVWRFSSALISLRAACSLRVPCCPRLSLVAAIIIWATGCVVCPHVRASCTRGNEVQLGIG